jgi:endogenous inhibitor of DNA gyrase (YacG/DUF329 family)
MHDLGNWASEKYVVSDPVFDMSELEAESDSSGRKEKEKDEDFKGLCKPDDTIH